MRYVVVGGLATEEVGGELLLCDASGTAVHRISGDARRYFERVARGDGELPGDQVTAALVAANVLLPVGVDVAVSRGDGMSRRQMMVLGATAAAAAGVVTVGLPSAVAAQSPGPAPEPEIPTYPSAPASGTPAGDSSRFGAFQSVTEEGVRQTEFEWTTSTRELVEFNWKVYSPGRVNDPSNLIAEGGPDEGFTRVIPVPGAEVGQTILWMVTAAGGQSAFFPTSFSS